MRKLFAIHWIELIFGPLPPTILFGVPTVLLLVVAVRSLTEDPADVRGALGVTGLSTVALGSLGAFWLVALMGPDWVNRHSWLRWSCVLLGAVGIGVTTSLWAQSAARYEFLFWLGGPIVVGMRYLLALLRGHTGT